MSLAEPAPKVEGAEVEPARESSGEYHAEPAKSFEEAMADPAQAVEEADGPRKETPSNALSYLQQRAQMSVEALRKDGTDFESQVAVCRGAPKKNFFKVLLPMIFDQRDFISFSEIARYAVIRGGVCFIYVNSTDETPLYAFSLAEVFPFIEDRDKPDIGSYTVSPEANTNKPKKTLVTVLLRNKKTKKISYQFAFDTERESAGVVKNFIDIVERNGEASSRSVEGTVVQKDGQQKQNDNPSEKGKSTGK